MLRAAVVLVWAISIAGWIVASAACWHHPSVVVFPMAVVTGHVAWGIISVADAECRLELKK